MGNYLVEMHGEVREVYAVQAESEAEAIANWSTGELVISEAEGMEFYSLREDEP